ncbi:MAG: recombinase family protein [Alphaproteobacteria bacterium]|nr:recombinase family protein [Alphaproteobacteria bacterium]
MKAVILARVSSREQENGMSIDAQLENMKNYIQRKELKLIKTFQITESSTKGDRKKFLEMLAFVKSQKDKIAIVADCVDRIQRSFKESVDLDELLKNDKIELHFLRENLRLHKDSTSSEIAMWDLSVFTAKTYVNNLRDNVKRGINYNVKQGVWQSIAPIGYLNRRDANNRPIIIHDPDRAVGIRRLFEEYSSRLHTLGDLVKKVEQFGLTNVKTGKPICRSQVFRILNNPFYYGMMQVKGALYPHIYEPLIDKALFDKCQDVMNGKGRARFKSSEIPFIFRGLIKCADCGCAISSDRKTKKSGREYVYLSCSHYKGNCTQERVNESVLLEQIEREVLQKLVFPPDLLRELMDTLKSVLKAENSYVLDEIARLREQQDKATAKRSKLLDLLLSESITQDDYANKKSELDEALHNIKVKLDAHAQADDTFINTLESLLLIASKANELFQSSKVEQKREILNLLLSNCTLADGKLRFSLRKPFDALVNLTNRAVWLGNLDSNQD